MKWFSERKGLTKPRTEIQVSSMDKTLRNRLWNVVNSHYIIPMLRLSGFERAMRDLMQKFYDSYLGERVDLSPADFSGIRDVLLDFMSKAPWSQVYDLLEFLVAHFPDKNRNERFKIACNEILEIELSAYRFVGGQITEIVSEEEISEIEEALETPLKPVRAHIENALRLLSDRKSPDHRNSIKESISAVEAICRLIARDEKATLGKALDIIETKVELHGALKRAFDSLYGYTSSSEGIRHAFGLTEEPSLSFEDAKFMLVSCSAFINYLIAKASKAGIKIGK